MASSSTFVSHKSFKFDVFLSFRGEDTRKNFIDHLCYALQQKNIHTFKDDKRIKKAKKIRDELLKSIEDSKFYIIVFSKNYASSSWCLDELVKIMECQKKTGHNAYPVFYDVEPSEIRKQSGVVGEAFAKLEKEEAAGNWREAMKEAADLGGWELKNTVDGHEAQFIQKIVHEISLELRFIESSVDGKLIGMESRVKEFVTSLEADDGDVRMIGIKGIGGGGKTTLARAIFDQISLHFDSKSFVENVREVSKASFFGLKSLQKQVLSDVLDDESIRVSSVYDGKNMMKNMIRGRKVLVVLDDVDHIDQLDALAGEPNWFKPGSRIIITTRDEQVLVAHRVNLIHDVNLLSDEEAISLFSRYAFGKEIPNQRYEKLSRKVVRYAAGLPLTIRVLGSFLCGKSDLEWKDALKRLKTIPLKETLEKLELSYIGLEEDYKEIFLDVACMLKGWEKEEAIKVLESCRFHARSGLRVLELKSLINISHGRYLGMHDHIEEMGRNIVRRAHPAEPNKHSRLWIDDEIENILTNDSGTEATECISLSTSDYDMTLRNLGNMKKLRYLHISCGCGFELDEDNQRFPNTLRYVYLYNYPFRSLSRLFEVDNLVGLKMPHSNIIQLWKGRERKVLTKLRFLDLSYSNMRTFDLRLTPNLETLSLKECHYFEELHMPFKSLNLRSLELGHSKLKTLDLGQAPNLERLDVESCDRLVDICAPVGCLKKLVYLNLSGCGRFMSFVFNKQIESPDIATSPELHLIGSSINRCDVHSLEKNVPKFQFTCYYKEPPCSSTGNLEKLLSLGLCACTNLDRFSRSICGLQCLRKLVLQGRIPEVPKDFDQLKYLEELILPVTTTKHLPDNFCLLKHLKYLTLNSLEKLPEDFGQLQSLEKLILQRMEIKHLPDSFCMLKHLKSFKLISCWHLLELPKDFGLLESLEELIVSSSNIKHLPDSICMLKHLKYVKLESCGENLLEELGQVESLEELHLSCSRAKHLPDSICKLKHLKSLKLVSFRYFKKLLGDLGRLECLEKLSLSSAEIRHLPDSICMLKNLKSLKLKSCPLLEKLPEELGQLERIEKLIITDCFCVKKLPEELGCLECLKELNIKGTSISHLPYNIFRLKGLRIVGSRYILQSCGFTSEIQTSGFVSFCYI